MGTTGNTHVSCKPICTCALTHAFQQLALSSATLQIHFELNTNATALLESLLLAVHTLAAAFLRRSSITGFPPNSSDSLIALTFKTNPTFGDNLRNQAFWTVRLPRTQQQRNWHAFAPQNMTLNVLILRWMNLLIFAFVSLLFVVGLMFSSEGKASYFGGYTMEMALKEKLQSANLSTPFLTFGFVSIRMKTNDDGFFPTRFEDQSMPFVLSR